MAAGGVPKTMSIGCYGSGGRVMFLACSQLNDAKISLLAMLYLFMCLNVTSRER
jgi:hypothetical protein